MRKILKLFFKCICVLFPVILLCLHCATSLMSFIDGEAPFYLWNKDTVRQSHDKIGVIILGDSTANAAYMPEVLSSNTLNLSLGGATSVENYYIMKEWLENNSPPKTVYISFTDNHMKCADVFWKRTMYSHRFSSRINMEILKTAIKYNELSILTDKWPFDFISYELYLPNIYITSLINASLNQRYDNNFAAYQGNELHGGRYIDRGNKEYVPDETIVYDSFSTSPFFDFYYQELIELCLENNIHVRLIKLPVPDNCNYTDDHIRQLNTYYNNLLKNYSTITFDCFPTYSASYFSDSAHLNTHGAFRFSRELRKLYPDDFSNQEMTENRIAAINDNIIEENKIEELYLWTKLGDWSLVSTEIENGTHIQIIDHYHNTVVLEKDIP